MKWNELFSLRLSELIASHIQKDKEIQLLIEEKSLRDNVVAVINRNFQEERELDKEVEAMLDNLEAQGHQFERYKMRPLVKAQLAKKKGFIL